MFFFLFLCFADDDQGVRQVSSFRHRIQDVGHHVPDDMSRGGYFSSQQVPHATPRPKLVLLDDGGDCAQGWPEDGPGAR